MLPRFSAAAAVAVAVAVLLVALAGAPAALAIPMNGLAGYYQFESNFNDSSGNGNTGTANGGLTFTTAGLGHPGVAGLFDGVDDVMTAGGDGSLNVGSDKVTAFAWVYSTGFDTTPTYILARRSGAFNEYALSIVNSTTVTFSMEGGPSPAVVSSGAIFTQNAWHLIAGTYDGTTARVYYDGAEVGSTAATGNLNALTSGTFYVGNEIDAGPRYWQGRLDEVAIYNRALSATEISNVFLGIEVPEPGLFALAAMGALGLRTRVSRRPR